MTLSQLEKLLPVVDNLGLLPLVAKNKELLLGLAPLIIEPAPLLLPLVVSILKTPASNFLFPGYALLAGSAYELINQNVLLAVPLILLGLPLSALGTILGSTLTLPEVPTGPVSAGPTVSTSDPFAGSRPVAKARKVAAPAPEAAAPKAVAAPKEVAAPKVAAAPVKVAAAPKVSAPTVSVKATGGSLNGKRKVVKIGK